MARRNRGNRGWLTCLVITIAAIVVVAGFVILVRYYREPLARLAEQVAATPTVAAPSPVPSASPAQTSPTRAPSRTPTPRRATPAASPTQRPPAAPTPGVSPAPTGSASGAATDNLILFVEPDAGRTPLLRGMELAQRSIDLVIYLLLDNQIVDGLIAAQQRGVAVRVMYEGNPFGGGDIDPPLEKLRGAGVQVKESNPTFRFTHQKTMLIDSRVAYIMTLNLTASAFTRNREYGIVDADPRHVNEIQAVFNADWDRARVAVDQPDLVWSPNNSREKLVALLASATRSLDIQTEVMGDAQVIEMLIGRARAGVKVRVIMSPPDAGSTTEAGLARLRQGGVEVGLIRTPYVHAKLVVVDGERGWIGSENFSDNSLDNNRELGILLRDAPIIQTLLATFERDWGRVN